MTSVISDRNGDNVAKMAVWDQGPVAKDITVREGRRKLPARS